MGIPTNKHGSGPGRHDARRAAEPIGGYPIVPVSVHNAQGPASELGIVAVADPHDSRRRQRAIARFDLLDRERRTGHLSEAAFLVGREVEQVFEGMSRISSSGQWFAGDRIDGSTAAELKAVLGIERAYAVNCFLAWMVRHIGRLDARLLWIVLGNRWTFALAAQAFGRPPGVRGLRYMTDRFRDALAALAEAKAAKGRAVR